MLTLVKAENNQKKAVSTSAVHAFRRKVRANRRATGNINPVAMYGVLAG